MTIAQKIPCSIKGLAWANKKRAICPRVFEDSMKIKRGSGFWYVDRYPYGGDFGRASRDEDTLVEVLEHGVLRFSDDSPKAHKVKLPNHRIAVIEIQHLIDV